MTDGTIFRLQKKIFSFSYRKQKRDIQNPLKIYYVLSVVERAIYCVLVFSDSFLIRFIQQRICSVPVLVYVLHKTGNENLVNFFFFFSLQIEIPEIR